MSQILDDEWNKNAVMSKPSCHLKKWWDKKCKEAYRKMEANPTPENKVDPNRYKAFRHTTRESKKAYFDKVIHETATEKNRPWDLMPWARERKLPAVEAIINNEGISCISPNMIFDTLHSMFNSANNRTTNLNRLFDGISEAEEQDWAKFSIQEVKDALEKCAKNSAPGPDHISWRLIKRMTHKNSTMFDFVSIIADSCIHHGYWPHHFKKSISIIIPKPNKLPYDKAKLFRPIILLNMFGKLIEKMIANRLQFESISNSIIHPCQTGGIIQRSTEDAGVCYDLNEFNSGCNKRQRLEGEKGIIN
jgi:hypothetical protein